MRIRSLFSTIVFVRSLYSTVPRFSGSRAVSMVIGSAIGGLLVQPVEHYPNVFSAAGVFGK